MKGVIVIGYSGHAYVIIDIFQKNHIEVAGYCENKIKKSNPYGLKFLGNEANLNLPFATETNKLFIAIGDNNIRRKIFNNLANRGGDFCCAIHPSATIGAKVKLGTCIAIMAGVQINPLVKIGNGAILNTASVIEHESVIGEFSHIAPGAVLCGGVVVGSNSFIGANSVIKQGIKIGNNVVVGAGSVVVSDIPDNSIVKGVPAK